MGISVLILRHASGFSVIRFFAVMFRVALVCAAPAVFSGHASAQYTCSGCTYNLGGQTVSNTGLVLQNNGTVSNGTFTSSGALSLKSGSVSAILAGSGALTKSSNGNVTLSGANTYSGGTTISAGTLALTGNGTLGSGTVGLSGGTLDIGTTNQTTGALTLTSGTITGAGSLTSTSYAVKSGEVDSILAGSGALTKSTAGNVTLTAANTYSGNTKIINGTLALVGNGSIASSSQVSIANGGTFDISQATNGATVTTISDSVANGGGTIQLGAQTLTITNAASTFSGSINDGGLGGQLLLTGGTLTLTGTSAYSGGTTVTNGASLYIGSLASVGTGPLIISNDGEISFTGTSNPVTPDIAPLSITRTPSTITVDGRGSIKNLNASSDLTITGDTTSGVDNILVLKGSSAFTGTTVTVGDGTSAGGLTLRTASTSALTSDMDLTINANSTLDLYGNDGTIGSLAGAGTVLSHTGPATLTLAGGGSSTFSGVLKNGSAANTLGLTLSDGSSLVLSGTSNTYSGDTTINAGSTLTGGATDAFSLNSKVTVNTSATLDMGGYNQEISALSGAGTVTNSGLSNAVLAISGHPFTVANANEHPIVSTFDGILTDTTTVGSGTLGLDIRDGSKLILNNEGSDYHGDTMIGHGVHVNLLVGGAEDAFSANSAIKISYKSTLDLGGYDQDIYSLADGVVCTSSCDPNLTPTVTNNGSEAAVLTISGSTANTTFSGAITDGTHSLGLTLINGASLTLSGTANTYSGTTTVGDGASASTLTAGAAGALSANSAVQVSYHSTLDIKGTNQTIASLSDGTSCTVSCTTGANQSGTVTNSTGSAATLTISGGATTTFSGAITDGTQSLGLTLANGSSLTLSGTSNTYSGTTTVGDGASASTLTAGAAGALSTKSAVQVSSASTLDVGGFDQTIASLSDGTNGGGTVTNSSTTAAATLTISGGVSKSFSGAITDGTQSLGLTLANGSSLTLSGTANTYSGTTTVGDGTNASTLTAGAAGALSANSAVQVSYLSTLDIKGTNQTIASLSDGTNCAFSCTTGANQSGTVTNSSTTAATLTISGGTTTTFSGTVQDGTGKLSLSLTNDSVLTLDGTVSYTGTTTVDATSHLYYGADSIVKHSGLVTNNGLLDVAISATATLDGGVTNESGATINNYGTVYDDLTNYGTVNSTGAYNAVNAYNNSGAVIKASGAWNGVVFNYSGATFTLTGDLTNDTNAFTNSGTLDLVSHSFTGLGAVSNLAGGYIYMSGPTQTLGMTSLTNAGVLSTLNGTVVTNVATLDGNYIGASGVLLLEANTVNTTAVRGNQVLITGSASGTTTVTVDRSGAALLFATPIPLITVSGSVTGTPFVLDPASASAGLVTYALVQESPGQYDLVSQLSGNANASLTGIGSGILSAANAIVSGFFDDTESLPRGAANPLSNHVDYSVWAHSSAGQNTQSAFGTIAVGQNVSGTALSAHTGYSGLQVGSDVAISNIGSQPVSVHFGLTGGKVDASVSQKSGSFSAGTISDQFIGAYGTLTAQDFFMTAQARYESWSDDVRNDLIDSVNSNVTGQGFGMNVKLGYSIALPNSVTAVPTIGYNYNHLNFGSLGFTSDSPASDSLHIGTLDANIGNIGVRLGYGDKDAVLRPYVSVAIFHDFGGSLQGAAVQSDHTNPDLVMPYAVHSDGTFSQFGMGMDLTLPGSGINGYVKADYRSGQNILGTSLSGGINYSF